MTGDLRGVSAGADRRAIDSGHHDTSTERVGAVIDGTVTRNNVTGGSYKESGAGRSTPQFGGRGLPPEGEPMCALSACLALVVVCSANGTGPDDERAKKQFASDHY